jgi:hypothetical protein
MSIKDRRERNYVKPTIALTSKGYDNYAKPTNSSIGFVLFMVGILLIFALMFATEYYILK